MYVLRSYTTKQEAISITINYDSINTNSNRY